MLIHGKQWGHQKGWLWFQTEWSQVCGISPAWMEVCAALTQAASARNVGDLGSIPGSGRSLGEGNGNPLQHSCLENPMDGGASMGSQKVGHDWATSLYYITQAQSCRPFHVHGEGAFTGGIQTQAKIKNQQKTSGCEKTTRVKCTQTRHGDYSLTVTSLLFWKCHNFHNSHRFLLW